VRKSGNKVRGSWALLLLGLVFFAVGCVRKPFNEKLDVPEDIRQSYITVWAGIASFFTTNYGSAVLIRDGLAVTNRHVVEDFIMLKGIMHDEIEFPIQNVVLSDSMDIAVFEVPCGLKPISRIGGRVTNKMKLYSLGTSSGAPELSGFVVATRFRASHQNLLLPGAQKSADGSAFVTEGFLYDAKIRQGYSGGPVVDEAGNLVGINQGYISTELAGQQIGAVDTWEGYTFAYHIEDVLRELDRIAPAQIDRCSGGSAMTSEN